MKLAIIHDYLNQYGGAERVVEAMHELFPEAPVYTSVYDRKKMPASFSKMDIRVSFMQRLPFIKSQSKKYLMLYPRAFRSFDLSGFDVILSSSSSFAKFVRKPAGSFHVCYCYTPTRFLWYYDEYIKRENISGLYKMVLPRLIERLKEQDLSAAAGVDRYIAISNAVALRIRDIYQADSEVIFPPVDASEYSAVSANDGSYLIISRLRGYKRIDLAVKAFNRTGKTLRIIGDGEIIGNLKKVAGNNIEFLGRLDETGKRAYLAKCKALVFPGEEDFGITPLEAQACGKPVIAYRSGGAIDTVIEGTTGVFFNEQTEEEVLTAINRLEGMKWNAEVIRNHSLMFDKAFFKQKLKDFLSKLPV